MPARVLKSFNLKSVHADVSLALTGW